jgi:hypothetical protein
MDLTLVRIGSSILVRKSDKEHGYVYREGSIVESEGGQFTVLYKDNSSSVLGADEEIVVQVYDLYVRMHTCMHIYNMCMHIYMHIYILLKHSTDMIYVYTCASIRISKEASPIQWVTQSWYLC